MSKTLNRFLFLGLYRHLPLRDLVRYISMSKVEILELAKEFSRDYSKLEEHLATCYLEQDLEREILLFAYSKKRTLQDFEKHFGSINRHVLRIIARDSSLAYLFTCCNIKLETNYTLNGCVEELAFDNDISPSLMEKKLIEHGKECKWENECLKINYPFASTNEDKSNISFNIKKMFDINELQELHKSLLDLSKKKSIVVTKYEKYIGEILDQNTFFTKLKISEDKIISIDNRNILLYKSI